MSTALEEHELAAIEATYGLTFPPDLRVLLREGPPISRYAMSLLTPNTRDPDHVPPPEHEQWGWFDWRSPRAEIVAKLADPFAGVASAFETTEYWLAPWGPRPAALAERMQLLAKAPVLIPLGGQHFMAAEPCEAGNPIFSIVGLDMIVAGCDLADYLAGGPRSMATKGEARHIRFWSDVLYLHWDGWLELLRREFADR